MAVEEEAVEAVSHLQRETNKSLASSGDEIGEGIRFNVYILSVHVFLQTKIIRMKKVMKELRPDHTWGKIVRPVFKHLPEILYTFYM